MLLGKLEADDAALTMVYDCFGKLHQHFVHDEVLQKIVADRLQFMYTDSMGLAYMLTPKFAAEGYYFDDDRREIVGYARSWALRTEPAIANDVRKEMIDFVTKMSNLSIDQQETIFEMDAKSYWTVFGKREFPALYKIAKPISEMVCSSAGSERAWSTFRFIHSRLRNRLANERVKKLVFVYTNCAMLDEEDKFDYISEEGAIISGMDCSDLIEEELENLL